MVTPRKPVSEQNQTPRSLFRGHCGNQLQSTDKVGPGSLGSSSMSLQRHPVSPLLSKAPECPPPPLLMMPPFPSQPTLGRGKNSPPWGGTRGERSPATHRDFTLFTLNPSPSETTWCLFCKVHSEAPCVLSAQGNTLLANTHCFPASLPFLTV